ncbi:hypothetical protein FIBSPDRAFT_872258, partial [Athelia psychrophila]
LASASRSSSTTLNCSSNELDPTCLRMLISMAVFAGKSVAARGEYDDGVDSRGEHKPSPPSTQESNLLTKLTSARHSSSFPARFSRSSASSLGPFRRGERMIQLRHEEGSFLKLNRHR